MAKEAGTAFISYTRQGGAACAERLHRMLREQGIGVWQDRAQMIAGIDFWRQIEEAIARCSHLVMVLTPDCFEGDRRVLRQEWYTARKVGTCVVPVMGEPGMRADDERLPRWLPSRHLYDAGRDGAKLVAQLKAPCTIERIPWMVEDLPEAFVPRVEEHEALVGSLLDERREAPVAVTTALQGAGGFGKTTLAQAVCHDDRVIAAFKDGILWVTLGEERQGAERRIEKKLAGLYAALTGERPQFVDQDDAANELAGKLQYKQCLIVVDDVWDFADLKPFLRGAEGSARLITTRLTAVAAQARAVRIFVDEMKTSEAAALLAAGLEAPGLGAPRLREIARRLGAWPILIHLFAGHVREAALEGMSADAAVEYLLGVLEERGITALDRDSASDRTQAVDLTLRASRSRLSPEEDAALLDLAVFPEDLDVPIPVVSELWGRGATATTERLRRFANLGLVRLNLGTGTVRLHDVIRRYLKERNSQAAESHARLVAAWPDRRALPHEYAWRWLPYHLVAAQRTPELRRLLADFAWLQAKLDATDIGALIADYDTLPAGDPLRLVQGALRLAAYCLAGDKAQMAGQLLGRLRPGTHPELDALLAAARSWRGRPWLRPLRPTLHAPGGPLVRVFRGYAGGHGGTVRSIAIDGAGRWAVSAGNSHTDRCIIVWNLAAGTHRRLEGEAEAGGRTPLAIRHDGELFVSAFGGEVRVWRTADGARLLALPGTGPAVTALAIADEGGLAVAGAADGSVVCWDLDAQTARRLGGHEAPVEAVAVTPDGSWAVSINAVDARLWNLGTFSEAQRWPTPGWSPLNHARCLEISRDGRSVGWGGYPEALRSADGAASFGGRHSFLVWDSAAREQRAAVSAPEAGGVLCFSLPGARALVTRKDPGRSEDGVALLVVDDPPRLTALTEIGRGVASAAISRDGRWGISADYEHDLMLWDLDRASVPAGPPVGAEAEWKGLRFDGFAGDGLFAVFGLETDRPLVWDLAAEAPLADAGRAASIAAAERAERAGRVESPDAPPRSRITSKSSPRPAFGRGHTAPVLAFAVAPHRRWDATASEDGTVRVWDRAAERQLAAFSDETILDGCSWANDGMMLAVTDYRGKAHLLRLEGVTAPDPAGG